MRMVLRLTALAILFSAMFRTVRNRASFHPSQSLEICEGIQVLAGKSVGVHA
jgi:hypothetical protein